MVLAVLAAVGVPRLCAERYLEAVIPVIPAMASATLQCSTAYRKGRQLLHPVMRL